LPQFACFTVEFKFAEPDSHGVLRISPYDWVGGTNPNIRSEEQTFPGAGAGLVVADRPGRVRRLSGSSRCREDQSRRRGGCRCA
jgi:hypothetical protein